MKERKSSMEKTLHYIHLFIIQKVSYESNTNSENKATLDTIVYLKFYLDMQSKEVVKNSMG